jgi:CheY-like chemotaxis protein
VLERLRVLVVDDEPSARELLTNLLGRFGADVQVAGSVREALDSVEASTPDVLLSDIAMAETDGYTLIRRVRALERTGGRRIAAIAVTALASAEDRERALAEGFDAHLTKPIEPAELVAMVASSARGSA